MAKVTTRRGFLRRSSAATLAAMASARASLAQSPQAGSPHPAEAPGNQISPPQNSVISIPASERIDLSPARWIWFPSQRTLPNTSPETPPTGLCGRSLNELESKLSGLALEGADLPLSVRLIVVLGSFVYERHTVAEHAIHQPGQLGRHGLGCDRSVEAGSESTELRTQVRVACV